ncbi:hypothetical protein FA15DRAFT_697481 [Coprinopsis marcescibilis]|uniref:G domain-containing protein n=1 Tax=Coprinopsis marcescibilis TaxID=230819 RepID=A0A5C3KI57_COPMA|nr:hypothetical protein FA15DRAFT_697481 [Coprinopsis marcescibilis]
MAKNKSTDEANSKRKLWSRVFKPFKIRRHRDEYSRDDIIIPVIGLTGVGKSSFINAVTGRIDAVVGHGLKSCTQDPQAVKMTMPSYLAGRYPGLSSRNIVFIDTPGFDDTYNADDSVILRRVSSWMAKHYPQDMTVAGIVYMEDISQKRMHKSMLTNLEMFQRMCGRESFHNVALVTTQWDTVLLNEKARNLALEREQELRLKVWKEFIDRGAVLVLGFQRTLWMVYQWYSIGLCFCPAVTFERPEFWCRGAGQWRSAVDQLRR